LVSSPIGYLTDSSPFSKISFCVSLARAGLSWFMTTDCSLEIVSYLIVDFSLIVEFLNGIFEYLPSLKVVPLIVLCFVLSLLFCAL